VSSTASASERGFVSNATMLTVAQYTGAGVGFATTLVAARLLGPEAFGVAAVVMAYPTVVSSLASVKTSAVTQRYVSGFRAKHQHPELLAVCKLGFAIDFVAMTVAAILVSGAVLVFGDPPGTNGEGNLVVLFALSLPIASLAGTSFVVLSAFRRFGLIAALQVAQKIVVFISVSAALLVGGGTVAFVVINAAWLAGAGLIWLIVASTLLSDAVGKWWTASWAPLGSLRGELRALLGWNFVGVTLSGAVSQVPILLLGGLGSPIDAGYFRVASTIAVTADSLEAAMNRVAYPLLAAAHAEGDTRRIARLVVAWSRREARLATMAVLTAMVLAPVLVLFGLGHEYGGMLFGTEILLVGTATSAAFFFLTPYLYSSGHVKRWVVWYGVYATGALALGWLLVDEGGFVAMAALIGGGQAVLNIALGLPILRHARQLTTSPASLGEGAETSALPATRIDRF
jgi:lipopolysaccharide exporter